jgi:hypothetical protein
MKIHHECDYAARRRADFPSLGDQLDAFWKGGDEAEAMRAIVMGVKARYPKPDTKEPT